MSILICFTLNMILTPQESKDLTGKVGVFSRIIEEHVSSANEYENLESEGKAQSNLKEDKAVDDDEMQEKEKSNKVQLMSEEERLYGQVAITVYTRFLAYAGSVFWGVVILALFVLMQGSSGTVSTALRLFGDQVFNFFHFSWDYAIPWVLDSINYTKLFRGRLYGSIFHSWC